MQACPSPLIVFVKMTKCQFMMDLQMLSVSYLTCPKPLPPAAMNAKQPCQNVNTFSAGQSSALW